MSNDISKDDIYKQIMEMPEHSHYAKDLNFSYIADGCNESTAKYADVDSPKNLHGKTDFQLIWADTSAESFIKGDIKTLRGRPQVGEKELVHVFNGIDEFLITKTKLFNNKGEVRGIIGSSVRLVGLGVTEIKGKIDIEKRRLNLGKAFNYQNLTIRQTEVFKELMEGHSTEEIAIKLNLRPGTIRFIIKELQSITGCRSLYSLIITAVKYGWQYLMKDYIFFKK
ncbi:helix-turn-helix transcriptional regulator [Rickettsiella endosymbiont of Dermanyssus gallinae]|uniref:helix-turn-helix transcriptional regulator n=1 Tax=Rickettsiella endosymbiont of Dermanyssus gallinae TaxID=2856608 RepID=UPI001C533A00|nr:helix-turn-helix transcriptional regulator [Rickettsiella endosymbiont of Dermanyssus gallinae]